MPDQPHKVLLDRDFYAEMIRQVFPEELSLLEELVNYGSNLIPRCFESSEKKLHDIVIVLNFFKNAVSLLDSIHILASKGSTISCYLPLRSLFEVYVYLLWIFKQDTERRANMYFVYELRNRLFWTLCGKKGTREYTALEKHLNDTDITPDSLGLDDTLIDTEIHLIRRKLNAPECRSLDREFEEIRIAKGNKLKDRHWFTPGGLGNFREMAKEVGKEGLYQVLYPSFSKTTHALTFDQQVNISEKTVVFEPIRNISNLGRIFRHSFNFGLAIYRLVLQHYRDHEIPNFKAKYENEWRTRFSTSKKVEYKDGQYTITSENLFAQTIDLTSKNWRPTQG